MTGTMPDVASRAAPKSLRDIPITAANHRNQNENSHPRKIPTRPANGRGMRPTRAGVKVWTFEAMTGRVAAVTSSEAPIKSPNNGMLSNVSKTKMKGMIIRIKS